MTHGNELLQVKSIGQKSILCGTLLLPSVGEVGKTKEQSGVLLFVCLVGLVF